MTIVSIRGTHGSGKSTIVTKIMAKYKATPLGAGKRPDGYAMALPTGEHLFVVGPYHTACGGCDAVQPYSDILPRIEEYAKTGHVLFEGALVSSSYGTIGAALNGCPGATFAFLDTPLDECLRRIAARRAAKGNFEPLNPKNTAVKHENVYRTKDQMRRLGSAVRIVDIDHREPVKGVLRLFGVSLRKEP